MFCRPVKCIDAACDSHCGAHSSLRSCACRVFRCTCGGVEVAIKMVRTRTALMDSREVETLLALQQGSSSGCPNIVRLLFAFFSEVSVWVGPLTDCSLNASRPQVDGIPLHNLGFELCAMTLQEAMGRVRRKARKQDIWNTCQRISREMFEALRYIHGSGDIPARIGKKNPITHNRAPFGRLFAPRSQVSILSLRSAGLLRCSPQGELGAECF
jgi:hypothetical protein